MLAHRLAKLLRLPARSNNAIPWARLTSNIPIAEKDLDIESIKKVQIQPKDEQRGTYEEMKEAVRRNGADPAKEWLSGSTTTGSTVYKEAQSTKQQLYNNTKRGMDDDSIGREGDDAEKLKSSTTTAHVTSSTITGKIKEHMDHAADVLESGIQSIKEKFGDAVGGGGDSEQQQHPVNARAVWEATRSEEQKTKAANASRKAQLTDEVYGTDLPTEATPRMEKDTVPDPLDTPH